MTADVTAPAESVRPLRRRNPAFGLSLRILGLVIAAVMTAEILLFLPSIARFRLDYLDAADRERHPGGAGARCHARQHGDRGGQARAPQPRAGRYRGAGRAQQAQARPDDHRAAPRACRPTTSRKSGMFQLIWDALAAMAHDGALLHPRRRRIDAPAARHGVDHRRRAADAHRDVRATPRASWCSPSSSRCSPPPCSTSRCAGW